MNEQLDMILETIRFPLILENLLRQCLMSSSYFVGNFNVLVRVKYLSKVYHD